ncbi:Phosphotransferase enzyme [Nowakowskiella sp. JEL0078]|nr:Phosphotransferase enzyme [Nowakowskiella sp. JEL0078]
MSNETTIEGEINFESLGLRKSKWVTLTGLVHSGTFKFVYQITFSDNSKYAVAVSRSYEEDFSLDAFESEVATMEYIRVSGLYPNVPVPKVYAFSLTFKNPVGAPYIIMDVVNGRVLRNEELNELPRDKQLLVVRRLAEIKSALSIPCGFSQIGCITYDNSRCECGNVEGPQLEKTQSWEMQTTDDITTREINDIGEQNVEKKEGKFVIGPFLYLEFDGINLENIVQKSGPHNSLHDLWSCLLERASLFALENWTQLDNDNIVFMLGQQGTPQLFKELSISLASMVSRLSRSKNIPQDYMTLCLHHSDFAIRNVMFDESFNVCGVIDWSMTVILPVIVTSICPLDLHSTPDEPFKISDPLPDAWKLVSFDWTNLGDRNRYPTVFTVPRGTTEQQQVDIARKVSEEISKFYLRSYFATCFTLLYKHHTHSSLAEGDMVIENRQECMEHYGLCLFIDAPIYLRLHEILMCGVHKWFEFSHWIRKHRLD